MAELHYFPSTAAMGASAAAACVAALNASLKTAPTANLMIATGNSQFAFYEALAHQKGSVDWSRVVVFHLDEYVGIPPTHSASFIKYLNERFVSVLRPGVFHAFDGAAADPAAEVARYSALLAAHPRDVCCFGIGENGHLAFNVRACAVLPMLRPRMSSIATTLTPCRTRRPWAARTSRTPRR